MLVEMSVELLAVSLNLTYKHEKYGPARAIIRHTEMLKFNLSSAAR